MPSLWLVPLGTDYHKREAVVVVADGPSAARGAARLLLEARECECGGDADFPCRRCRAITATEWVTPTEVEGGAYLNVGCDC